MTDSGNILLVEQQIVPSTGAKVINTALTYFVFFSLSWVPVGFHRIFAKKSGWWIYPLAASITFFFSNIYLNSYLNSKELPIYILIPMMSYIYLLVFDAFTIWRWNFKHDGE